MPSDPLVQTEAQLLAEFHYWLGSAELLPIRQEIAKALAEDERFLPVDLFLTCDDLELSRLPWEVWEIGNEFAVNRTLRIARTAVNIREAPAQPKSHGKVRVLAILGDDTGLSLQADRSALQSLSSMADVVLFDCQKEVNGDSLIDQIRQAIAEPQGWDILFFAGHSSETIITGGELAIAPGVTILLSEIAPQLIQAKDQGLQFAIFNSCNGLTIAEMLVDLGLSQVAVMREPIHNQVAQEFLLRFLQGVVAYQDVHDATLFACQHLKLERNLTYPSAYLIPSLFRHPDTQPFQLQPWGWKQQIKQWMPTKGEAIGLAVLLALTLLPPIPRWLMDQRVLVQAIYRQQVAQAGQPEAVSKPPIVLVQIDEQSIKRAKIADPKPMPRDYLAKLVQQVSALDARVIGIDYLLDRPHPQDPELRKMLQAAVEQHRWLVFAASEAGGWLTAIPELANPNWSLHGDTYVPFWHIRPLHWKDTAPPPFAYLLATAYRLETESFQTLPHQLVPQPSLKNDGNLLTKVTAYTQATVSQNPKPLITQSMKLGDITAFSYDIDQRWLQPLLDFSIPPNQVYISIPTWQLLEQPDQILKAYGLTSLKQAIVIIAAGGYTEAGIKDGEDNFPIPPAIAYWREQHALENQKQQSNNSIFSGGEAHAYMTHHFLTHHLVIPIPDLWIVLLAIPIGKALSLRLKNQRLLLLLLTGTTIGYGAISLQLYSSVTILFPWLFPTATLWMYVLLTQRQRNNA